MTSDEDETDSVELALQMRGYVSHRVTPLGHLVPTCCGAWPWEQEVFFRGKRYTYKKDLYAAPGGPAFDPERQYAALYVEASV